MSFVHSSANCATTLPWREPTPYSVIDRGVQHRVSAPMARGGDLEKELGFEWSLSDATHHYACLGPWSLRGLRAAGQGGPVGGLWQDVHDLEGLPAF